MCHRRSETAVSCWGQVTGKKIRRDRPLARQEEKGEGKAATMRPGIREETARTQRTSMFTMSERDAEQVKQYRRQKEKEEEERGRRECQAAWLAYLRSVSVAMLTQLLSSAPRILLRVT